jgi:putative ABC transport system substrate-binding protein
MRRRTFLGLIAAAAAWPLTAPAQQQTMPVVGFMSGRSEIDSMALVAAFRQGLGETGFVDGRNVIIEFRWANGHNEQLPDMAAELVNRRVAVLVSVGGDSSALAAKRATSTIPIVFGVGGDPVTVGLVDSFNRPGANLTGFTLLTNEMESKRLGLLREIVPAASLVGVLLNPTVPAAAQQMPEIQDAARRLGEKLIVVNAGNDEELNAAFALLVQQRVKALLVAANTYFDVRREQIIGFAAQNRIPAIYQVREYAALGGLMSYGPRITDGYRQAGSYVGQILKGAKPADLPIIQPTRFELVINLKTAKALGLVIPNSMQLLADELVE